MDQNSFLGFQLLSIRESHDDRDPPRIQINSREIQSLLVGNQRLAAAHVALEQDLAAAQHDLRHLSVVAGKTKSEGDAEVRKVHERALKLDAEVRAIGICFCCGSRSKPPHRQKPSRPSSTPTGSDPSNREEVVLLSMMEKGRIENAKGISFSIQDLTLCHSWSLEQLEMGPKVVKGDLARKLDGQKATHVEHHLYDAYLFGVSDSALKFTHILYNLSPAATFAFVDHQEDAHTFIMHVPIF